MARLLLRNARILNYMPSLLDMNSSYTSFLYFSNTNLKSREPILVPPGGPRNEGGAVLTWSRGPTPNRKKLWRQSLYIPCPTFSGQSKAVYKDWRYCYNTPIRDQTQRIHCITRQSPQHRQTAMQITSSQQHCDERLQCHALHVSTVPNLLQRCEHIRSR